MKKLLTISLSLCAAAMPALAQSKYSPSLMGALSTQQKAATRAQFSDAAPQPATQAYRTMLSTTDAEATLAALEAMGVKGTRMTSSLVNATLTTEQMPEVAAVASVTRMDVGGPVHTSMVRVTKETGIRSIHSSNSAENALQQPYTGKGIVVGIVDNGFEYGHPAFFDANGNYRVKRVWNQNITHSRTPMQFDYGAEYRSTNEILEVKCDNTTNTHGTHVAGLAAGSDRFVAPMEDGGRAEYMHGAAEEAEIVLVSANLNSSGSSTAYIADGVKYIMDYADEVGKPCVINLSLGSNYGPHDGTSTFDLMLDELTGPGRIVVGAIGNSGDVNLHASKTLTEEDREMRVAFGFSSTVSMGSVVDIWSSNDKPFKLTCVVVDNLKGKVVSEVGSFTTAEPGTHYFEFYNEQTGCTGYYQASVQPENVNGCMNVSIENICTNVGTSRKLGYVIEGEPGTTFHLWNCKEDPFISITRGGWTFGDSQYTLNELGGTGRSTITVGAYALRSSYTDLYGDTYLLRDPNTSKPIEEGAMGFFSSRGPSRDGRIKPEVSAPGVLVCGPVSQYFYPDKYAMELHSIDATGRTYYYTPVTGTSMSSPIVAGIVACWLEANPTLTPAEAKDIIARTARRDAAIGAEPDYISGYGKIDAYRGLLQAAGQGEPDGITTTAATVASSAITYDLRGRTLAQPQRGQLYISSGQKAISGK